MTRENQDNRLSEIRAGELIPRLVSEFGCSDYKAGILAADLESAAPSVRRAFLKWWNNAELDPLEVEGFTAERLMKEYRMNAIGAFLTLDALTREPERTKQVLARGFDKVGPEFFEAP